jgi:hypothetical protein
MSFIKWMLCIYTVFLKLSFTECLILDGEIATDKKVNIVFKSFRIYKYEHICKYTDVIFKETIDIFGYCTTEIMIYYLLYVQGLAIRRSILLSKIVGENDVSLRVSRSKNDHILYYECMSWQLRSAAAKHVIAFVTNVIQ